MDLFWHIYFLSYACAKINVGKRQIIGLQIMLTVISKSHRVIEARTVCLSVGLLVGFLS